MLYFFYVISYLKCYINFDTFIYLKTYQNFVKTILFFMSKRDERKREILFYLYNFDIFVYLCCVCVIFRVMSYFLSSFNYFFVSYSYHIIVLYSVLSNLIFNRIKIIKLRNWLERDDVNNFVSEAYIS